ncbi:HsdM family class I SAM-dependent methyltransferase [Beggiatoa leptomitoformis]|uniref:site-specific DNA-methyltransferase (adenine-specific) n=1 Tax=Beggiatoa leptomitoformis TaxID=288004 RepID=A0A2N9YEG0_9GAMM|nr:N-6 DNA methylase [Beggiatoa leptomitoformis]ALG68763.1 N-6 DNA methylase [Beggiatoa leptomitoformis]AUI68877.1 N-6 DNA methylase [Beggiatoa leptomitoformis]
MHSKVRQQPAVYYKGNMDTREIAQKLWEPAKALQQNGLAYHDYVDNLTWLLFLKIAPAIDMIEELPATLNWRILLTTPTAQQLAYYQHILITLRQSTHPSIAALFSQARTQLKTVQQLKQLLETLTVLDDIVIDDLGEIYGEFLDLYALNDQEHLVPPRSLVDTLVILTQPQLGELIHDPAADTAGFLVAADQYVQITSDCDVFEDDCIPDITPAMPQAMLLGIEQDLARQRLAIMHCLLHEIDDTPHLPVQWGNSLLMERHALPSVDVVLSSLVFITEQRHEATQQTQTLALLRHSYHALKPKGRAAIIVPDAVLHATGHAQKVRKELLDNFVVHTVLRLPQGIFYPHQIPAHVLFFYRGEQPTERTQNVWFYDMRSQSTGFGRHLRLKRQHLMGFETAFGEDNYGTSPRQGEGKKSRWHSYSRQWLTQKNDSLDLAYLHEQETNSYEGQESIWTFLESAVAELEDLRDLLGG